MRSSNLRLRAALAAAFSMAALPLMSANAQEPDNTASLDEVVVTGSRIRGTAPVGSSVIGMERADIDTAGGLTVDRIIKEIPQVFDLGVSESSRGQSGGGGNIVFGNTINLHGIGPYATLVLVDGHRVVNNSRSVDPSIIPSLGLERIEIVADGASAIYGSDAVAGVVNLVPRRSLDGIDTSLRYAVGDEFDEHQAAIAGGKVWDSGQVMVAYEHSFRSNLNGDDRDFFTSDLRSGGGSDGRVTRCSPGTIRVGATAPTATTTYAIPAAGVTPATAATLVAGTTNLCNVALGQDLLPEQKYNSVNATFTQRFTDWFEIFADGFYSKRDYVRQPSFATVDRLPVPATNAFFVQPPGAVNNTYIDYNFVNDLPRDTQTGQAENWQVTPGLRFNLPGDFRVETLFSYGKGDDQADSSRGINNTALTAALASNNPATAFDPYGLHRTSADTLAAISNQIFFAPTLNTFKGYEARLDGPLVDLYAGSLRVALGYEGQEMDSSFGTARGNPGTPMVYRDFSRRVQSGYVEFLVPIVGNANAIPGIAKLDLTAAVRYDDYSDVGNTTNPKFGLNWSPIDSLTIRGTYGTSFRAPLISEIYGNSNALFGQNYANPAGGAPLVGFALSGENKNLSPEEATTWTAGVDWKPTDTTNISLTYFDVKYESQVNNYLSNLSILSLESEFTGTGIILRGTEARDRVLALLAQGITLARGTFPGGSPNNVTLFVDGRNNNLGTSVTRGIDLLASQSLQTDSIGSFKFNVSGSYFTKYEVAFTPGGVLTDRLNTIFYPLLFKGRASATWEYGPVATQLAVNYVHGYDNNATTPVQRVDDYKPVDLSVTLHGDNMEWLGSFGSKFSVSLEARNVFDEEPPFVNIAQSGNGGGGFDPTTTNPVGRLIGIRLSKRW